MIYLHRYTTDDEENETIDIAVVEDVRGAERYEAKGYRRCTYEAFRADWRLRDERRGAQLKERMVGDGA